MATQTVRIRPCCVAGDGNELGETQALVKPATVFPADTPAANWSTLISEEVADDDATYLSVTTALGTSVYFRNPILDYVNVSKLKLVCRNRLTAGTTVYMGIYASETTGGEDMYSIDTGNTSLNTWATSELVVSDVCDITQGNWVTIEHLLVNISPKAASSTKGTQSVDITQVYLEVTYEEKEENTVSIYMMQNGVWAEIIGTPYKKINGVWVEADNFAFTNGTQYTVLEMS